MAASPAPTPRPNPFGARGSLTVGGTTASIYRLSALAEHASVPLERLPFTVRILLENLLRNAGTEFASEEDVLTLANWTPDASKEDVELAFLPARVILQDFTGVPCVVDLSRSTS